MYPIKDKDFVVLLEIEIKFNNTPLYNVDDAAVILAFPSLFDDIDPNFTLIKFHYYLPKHLHLLIQISQFHHL